MRKVAFPTIFKNSFDAGYFRHQQILELAEGAGLEMNCSLIAPSGGAKYYRHIAILGCASLLARHPPPFGRLLRFQRNLHWLRKVSEAGIRYHHWRRAIVAGIPVVANRLASLGWEGLDGAHSYSTWDEAGELLRCAHSMPPPPTPQMEETAFVDSLRVISSRPRSAPISAMTDRGYDERPDVQSGG